MLKKINRRYAKRIVALIIAFAVIVSSLVLTPLISSADTAFKQNSKVYKGDFSAGDTLDGWVLTSPSDAEVESGTLNLSAGESSKGYSSAIIRPDTEKYLNQQMRVDYKCIYSSCNTSPTVWLRALLREEGNDASLVGYYAKPGVAGSINKYEIWKRYFDESTNGYKDVMLCRAGRIYPSANALLGVELNVSGSNPTVITLRTFKNGNIGQTAVAVDNEASLQSAGTAAVAVYKNTNARETGLDIVSIAYDSADKVKDGYYALETGNSVGRFSTMVSVYQDREYVFSAKTYNAENYEPLFIRYDTDSQAANNNNASIIDLDMSTVTKSTQEDITTHTYTFKISDLAGYKKTTNGYLLDANSDYQVPLFLGVDLKDTSLKDNQYFGFELKEVTRDINDTDNDGDKDEIIEYGPNLIANGDFKYGLSGWSDQYHSTAQTLDWGSLCGKVSLVSDGETISGLVALYKKESETIEKEVGLFNYSADFSNGEVLSDWIVNSSSNVNLDNGKLNITAGENNTTYSSLIMRPDTEAYLNSTVRLDYKTVQNVSPVVWARANVGNPNSLASTTGYYVKTSLNPDGTTKAELYKRYLNSSNRYVDEKLMNCGISTKASEGSVFGIEIVTEGANPTVITVRSYNNDVLVSSNVVTDSETELQDAGRAGISVYGVKNSSVNIEGFTYTSDDNVVDEQYIEQIAKCEKGNVLGQQISADKNKAYILSATVEENTEYQPFYIAYKDKNGAIKENVIDIADCTVISENGLKTYAYSVDFSKMDYSGYVSEDYRSYINDGGNVTENDLIPVIVGVKTGNAKLMGNKYSAFKFRENLPDGSFGPNLIANGEFKSGLLGWSDCFSGTVFESMGLVSKVGDEKTAEGLFEIKKADSGLASIFGTTLSYSADFTSKDGWQLSSSNAVISDGKLTLTGSNDKDNYVKNSAFYTEKKLNQLVITEFYTATNNQKHINQLLWVRANQKDSNDIATLVGYYAKFNTHNALEVYKRIENSDGEYEDILIGKAGNPYASGDSRVRRVELAVEGSNPTKISASVYKYGAAGTANENTFFLMSKNVFFDSEADLQNVGMAGASISLNETKDDNSLDITKFEYYSTDGQKAENLYVEKPSSTTGRTRQTDVFSQILAVDPNETYVVEALVSQENVGLRVDYKNGAATTKSQTILLDNYGIIKENEQGQRIVRYEFNLVQWASDNGKPAPYAETMYTNGRKSQTLITFGFSISNSKEMKYSGLKIYAKNDAERKNLLTNADFKMGLYSWLDNGGSNAYISCNAATFGSTSTTTATNIVNLVQADKNGFDGIFNVQDDETIIDYENYDGKYMLHIKDDATFALGKIGQMIELESGKTYVYEVKYKYIVNKSVDPYVFCYKTDIDSNQSNLNSSRITLEWDYQEIDADNSMIYCEFHIPEEAYIYDENGNKAESGKAKAMIAVSTGQPGADCYFAEFTVYEKDDPEKTNLMGENHDFTEGWKNWILARSFEIAPMTEVRWTVADFPAELLPYDSALFINDTNDHAWNDGDWAAKFGEDDPIPEENTNQGNDELLQDTVIGDLSDGVTENVDNKGAQQTVIIRKKRVVVNKANNTIWYIVAGVSVLAVLAVGATAVILIIKKRKKRNASAL